MMSEPRACLVKGCSNPVTGNGLHCGRDDCARWGGGTDPGPKRTPSDAKPVHDEATEQINGIGWLHAHGWQTWRIGQRDARGTQDSGVPDVVAIHPAHGLLWWEVKGKGGRQSDAQREFEARCHEAGVPYVCGGLAALRAATTVDQTPPEGTDCN